MSFLTGILLVGGTGFVGRALAASLAAEGREVHVLSRKPAFGLLAGVQGHVGDQTILSSRFASTMTMVRSSADHCLRLDL